MRLLSVLGTSVLALAIAVPVYAQQEQHDQKEEEKGKPAQENEKRAQPAKPAKQDEKTVQQQDKGNKQEEKSTQQQNRNNQEENNARQHVQPAQRGGGRIPDDRYRANFGQEHRFRVNQSDYNNRRFQYGGYWFGFEGAWPSNWLYTQDVFVVEIDGVYYLCNANYPGVNIALSVTL